MAPQSANPLLGPVLWSNASAALPSGGAIQINLFNGKSRHQSGIDQFRKPLRRNLRFRTRSPVVNASEPPGHYGRTMNFAGVMGASTLTDWFIRAMSNSALMLRPKRDDSTCVGSSLFLVCRILTANWIHSAENVPAMSLTSGDPARSGVNDGPARLDPERCR
jgi:hypothetical protein